MIVGLMTYLLSTKNPKIAELGRIAFGCGLLALLFNVGGQAAALLR